MYKSLTTMLALATALLAGCASPGGTERSDPTDALGGDGLAQEAQGTQGAADAGPSSQPQGGKADPNGTNGAEPGSTAPNASAPGSAAAGVSDEPVWAALADAAIHPGIQTFTDGAQCTANFVFYEAVPTGGFDLYIGQAAHCAGTGAATETNGCTAESLPLGTKVDLGTGNDGELAYSSWLAMQRVRTDASAPECQGNDFALVRIAEADEARVSPQVPFFGGPTGLTPTDALGTGQSVYSFGNSGLRFGVEPVLSWKHGNVVFADAWVADVYTATPGVPGDSGSGFLTADGRAFGVLSTVAILPLPLSNQVSGLAPALDYAAAHEAPAVQLGTAPWTGGIV